MKSENRYANVPKIVIDRIWKENEEQKSRLCANVILGEREQELFFEVEEEYGKYFCDSRADCFVVALLPQAAIEGVDIESRVPVSERLLFQLNTFLCGLLGHVYKKKAIHVSAPVDNCILDNAGAVGTGITCGIDSLYTVASYSQTSFKHHNLTHLCFFNVGSQDIGRDTPDELIGFRMDLGRRFCAETGLCFVYVNSNVHNFSSNYARYFTLLNVAAVMSLPKLFTLYFHSSGCSITDINFTALDIAHFEVIVLDMVSLPGLKFVSAGAEVSRIEKVRSVTDYPQSYHYLNVCNTYHKNCGQCVKCLRTLYELDVCNALDKYATVFNLTDYLNNINKYLGDCFARAFLRNDVFCRETWPMLQKKHKISIIARLLGIMRFIQPRLKLYSLSDIRYLLKETRG